MVARSARPRLLAVPRQPCSGVLCALAIAGGAALSLQACAGSQPVPSSRDEIDALRAELRSLTEAQRQTTQQHTEQFAALRQDLQAQLGVLSDEVVALRSHLAPKARHEPAGRGEPHARDGEGARHGRDGQVAKGGKGADPAARRQAATKPPPKRPRRRRPKPAEAPPPPMSQSEQVRTLMASVAARLQAASEAQGGAVPKDRQRRAREHLVKADRAAALSLWARAGELAADAGRLLEGRTAGAHEVQTPGELEALMRDAEQLFPGRVRAAGDGLAVQLRIRRGDGRDLPVDRASLSHIGRLARLYDRMRLTVQVREPVPDEERAERDYDAVRSLLMRSARVSEERIEAAKPLTRAAAIRESAGYLLIGFSAS